MPYKDPSRKREWEETHRADKKLRFRQAADWADYQIQILRKLGKVHSRAEWAELRSQFVKQFLRDSYGLGVEPPISAGSGSSE